MPFYAVKQLLLSAIVATVLFGGLASQQAYANQLDAVLVPDKDRSLAEFAGQRVIDIHYPKGSGFARIYEGKDIKLDFTVQGNQTAAIVRAVNDALLAKGSPVMFSDAKVRYLGEARGFDDRLQLSYRVELEGTISRYTLQTEASDRDAIVDLDWRNFVVNGPVVVDSGSGSIDINRPSGLLEIALPELAQKLELTEAKEPLSAPLLDFHRFDLPMGSWHFLFDVTGEQLKDKGVFLPGEGGTVSVFSIGECSIREGRCIPQEWDAQVFVDGAPVEIHASTAPPSGQITIAGYAKAAESSGTEFALVNSKNSGGPVLGFQMQVLMVLGGMMGAVAVFVLYKSRR